jgi:hypothetical protein
MLVTNISKIKIGTFIPKEIVRIGLLPRWLEPGARLAMSFAECRPRSGLSLRFAVAYT